MDVVENFLAARRAGRADEAIELVGDNAHISFPWGGLRAGEHVKHYLRNETGFVRKEYLSSSIPLKEVAPNTFQRVYKWDKGQYEYYSGNINWMTRLLGGKNLPVYREVYFVRDGKIAHALVNKDPTYRGVGYFFSYIINPFAKTPAIVFQGDKL